VRSYSACRSSDRVGRRTSACGAGS
jgi:hypothetical protein